MSVVAASSPLNHYEVETFRLLLVGKTGSGKSATGNTLLGEERFVDGPDLSSETSECQLERKRLGSVLLEVMDCPGLFDTSKSAKDVFTLLFRGIAGIYPGAHAILYVVQIGRYTNEEFNGFEELKAIYGPDVVNHIIIVFTHADKLVKRKITIDEYVNAGDEKNKSFHEVLAQCGHRYVEFNNTTDGPRGQQIEVLLIKIREMGAQNGLVFWNKAFELVGNNIKMEVEKRLKSLQPDRQNEDNEGLELEMTAQERENVREEILFHLRQELVSGRGLSGFDYACLIASITTVYAGAVGCAVVGGQLLGPLGVIAGLFCGLTAGGAVCTIGDVAVTAVAWLQLRNHLAKVYRDLKRHRDAGRQNVLES